MGVALYKADFLYPKKHTEPLWFKHEDVGPYLEKSEDPSLKKDEKSQKEQMK